MYHLHDFASSGNGYKVRLLLTQLGHVYRYTQHNLLAGATHTRDFLEINPNGKIPVLITPEGKALSESNAILCFLAEGTAFMPDDSWERAQTLQWLFWEQYSHEPFIATSRFWMHLCDPTDFRDKLADRRPGGLKALKIMDDHLSRAAFFVADRYTIADIALYAYTHVAGEGGFSLDDYPNIENWLQRVRQQQGHITINDLPKS